MEKIAINVSKIETEHRRQMTDEAREMFESFYVQVCHQPVAFSACGFFTLNMELLVSVVTSVLSYLVILVQFQAS
jgi:7tm Chemosensory receptor